MMYLVFDLGSMQFSSELMFVAILFTIKIKDAVQFLVLRT